MAPTVIVVHRVLSRSCAQRGFTLFETIIVIALLALVSAGLLAMQPQVFKVQNDSRDQEVGLELMRACAERLLALRRTSSYGLVTSTSCNGMGGIGGFASNLNVTLTDASNATVSTCASATCTATILATKTSGTASLVPLTVRLFSY